MSVLDSLRFVWSQVVLDESFLREEISRLLESRFRSSHPLAEAFTFFLAKKIGAPHPPLQEKLAGLTMKELCELAILREILGKEGSILGRKLLPFTSFPSLWCSEDRYQPREAKNVIRLLLQAFGKEPIGLIEESPYFRALAKVLPKMEEANGVFDSDMIQSLDLGKGIENAFVILGENVPLGAMKMGRIEIPSFGPQVHPLNNPHFFGIYSSVANPRWAAVSAKKEIWFEYFAQIQEKGLEVRFFGLTPETAVSFVFYVKAEHARIDHEVYLPKSLRRYVGASQKVVFESGGDRFSIENMCSSKMEMIPLAGNGCFWDSDFLLGFEIPPHDGRAVFSFSL